MSATPTDRLRAHAMWMENFSSATDSGLPIVLTLKLFAEHFPDPALRAVSGKLATAMEDGQTITSACREFPTIFDPCTLALIQCGEVGGILDTTLRRAAQRLTWEADLDDRITRRFGSFAEAIRLVITTSSSESPAAKFLEVIAPKVPAIDALTQALGTARSCRALAVCLSSGTPIIDATEAAAVNAQHHQFSASLRTMRNALGDGKTCAEGLTHDGSPFSAMTIQLIAIGESTGALDLMFERIANDAERDVIRLLDQS